MPSDGLRREAPILKRTCQNCFILFVLIQSTIRNMLLFSVFFSTKYRCSLVGITFALCLFVLLIRAALIQQAVVSSSHLLLLLYRSVTYLLSKKDRLASVWLSSAQSVNVHFWAFEERHAAGQMNYTLRLTLWLPRRIHMFRWERHGSIFII